MATSKVDESRKKTGGRKPGTPNKRNAETQAQVAASGLTPLEFMLKIMRNDTPPDGANDAQTLAFHSLRFEAAKAAAPYVHAKLASVEVTGKDGGPVETITRVELVPLAKG